MPLLQKISQLCKHPLLLLAIRLGVGGIFIAFGVVKAIEPHEEFFSIIATYDVLPPDLVPLFGVVLIAAEIIVGFMFVTGLYMRYATYAILLLLVMFMVAIVQTMVRGIPLENCGCSGSLINLGESAQQVLFRDGILLVGALWVLYVGGGKFTIDRWFKTV